MLIVCLLSKGKDRASIASGLPNSIESVKGQLFLQLSELITYLSTHIHRDKSLNIHFYFKYEQQFCRSLRFRKELLLFAKFCMWELFPKISCKPRHTQVSLREPDRRPPWALPAHFSGDLLTSVQIFSSYKYNYSSSMHIPLSLPPWYWADVIFYSNLYTPPLICTFMFCRSVY